MSYSKGQFGIDQNIVLLTSFCAFILAFMFGTFHNNFVGEKFESIKNNQINLSTGKTEELSRLATLPDLKVILAGTYQYLVEYRADQMMVGTVDIKDSSIVRTISVNHYSMFGQADYEIVGSTVQYKNIEGDKYLFSDKGSVIGVDQEHGTFVELDGDMKLFIEAQYAKDNYVPFKKTTTPHLQQLKNMSVWMILQWICIFVGMGILSFVLYKLISNRVESKKAASKFQA